MPNDDILFFDDKEPSDRAPIVMTDEIRQQHQIQRLTSRRAAQEEIYQRVRKDARDKLIKTLTRFCNIVYVQRFDGIYLHPSDYATIQEDIYDLLRDTVASPLMQNGFPRFGMEFCPLGPTYNDASVNLGHVRVLYGGRFYEVLKLELWHDILDFYNGNATDFDNVARDLLGRLVPLDSEGE